RSDRSPDQGNGRKWCLAHIKGDCDKGGACPNPHNDKGNRDKKDQQERGRTPSRDGNGKDSRWKRRTNESS
ncbi:MAG: hypothetical protein ACKPKO_30170, partial [Candidatus Fonsibacter sp.]